MDGTPLTVLWPRISAKTPTCLLSKNLTCKKNPCLNHRKTESSLPSTEIHGKTVSSCQEHKQWRQTLWKGHCHSEREKCYQSTLVCSPRPCSQCSCSTEDEWSISAIRSREEPKRWVNFLCSSLLSVTCIWYLTHYSPTFLYIANTQVPLMKFTKLKNPNEADEKH